MPVPRQFFARAARLFPFYLHRCLHRWLNARRRDIHHMFDFIAVIAQDAPEHIFKNISAQVADMRIPINRWSAGVKRNQIFVNWFKFFNFATNGIVEFYHSNLSTDVELTTAKKVVVFCFVSFLTIRLEERIRRRSTII